MASRLTHSPNISRLESRNKEPRTFFPGEELPLVESGTYELVYAGHSYGSMFRGAVKLMVKFRIVSLGPHNGVILVRFYNVKKRNKGYEFARNGDLRREMNTLFGRGACRHGIPWNRLKGEILRGEVSTVTKDTMGRFLTDPNRYSKVARLLGIAPR